MVAAGSVSQQFFGFSFPIMEIFFRNRTKRLVVTDIQGMYITQIPHATRNNMKVSLKENVSTWFLMQFSFDFSGKSIFYYFFSPTYLQFINTPLITKQISSIWIFGRGKVSTRYLWDHGSNFKKYLLLKSYLLLSCHIYMHMITTQLLMGKKGQSTWGTYSCDV